MIYLRVFTAFIGSLMLLSCANTATSTKQFSTTISKNINYANFNSITKELDAELILWKPVSDLRFKRQKGLSRMGISDMTYKRYFCATYLFGIDSNGELKDVVLQNTYGDDKLALQAVKTLQNSKWVATEHNLEKKPGIYVLDMFSFRANNPNKDDFIKHCPIYFDANVNSFDSPNQTEDVDINKLERIHTIID